MRIRSLTATVGAAITALVLCVAVALPAGATALDQQHTSSAMLPAVRETAKLTLSGETSIAAPAFSSISGGFEGFRRSVIAWTGSDPGHSLNVMTSREGLTDYTNKVTLGESSTFSPAVTQMEEVAGNAIILAWTGTDASHRVNFLFNVYGTRQKFTLRETSFAAPAITFATGDILIAWTGTDTNRSLNVMKISLRSMQPLAKRTLPFSSNAGPSLINVNGSVVLGWTTKSNRLNFASSPNGLDFSTVLGAGLPDSSAFAPVVVHFRPQVGPEYWMSWTGTDSAHHLNLEWTKSYPHWPDGTTKTVLAETALGGPGIGYNNGLLVAWTGTDPAHHLNIARFES